MNLELRPPLRGVIAFTAGYMALAFLRALVAGNWEFVGYLVVMGSVIGCLAAVDRRCPMPPALPWTFSGWGLLHLAGGLVPIPEGWFERGTHPVLYNWWLIAGLLRYDQVIHAYGFGITTWLVWHIVSSSFRAPDGSSIEPTLGIMVLCIAASMGFGAFNEVVEFSMTLILPDTNVGDYANVGWDLVSNLVGALLCVILVRAGRRSKQRSGKAAMRPGAVP